MLWGAYVAACTAQRQQKDSNPFLWTVIQSVFWKIGRNSEDSFEKKEEKKHTHTKLHPSSDRIALHSLYL